MTPPREFRVRAEHDVVDVTRAARDAAIGIGLSRTEAVQLATAVSELAVNQLQHAAGGTISVAATPRGVVVDARDDGPGIDDIALALTDGFSTRGGLGLGLPGARRLVDEFSIASGTGRGTAVRLVKWSPAAGVPLAAGDVAEWASSAGRAAPATAVVQPFAGGLLLAVAAHGAEALRARPAAPPPALAEACGGRDVAVAVLGAYDGHLAWQAEPGASAALRRDRRTADQSLVLHAPSGRAATLGVLRDDLVVLASFPGCGEEPPPAGTAHDVAAALAARGPADGVVLAARVRRGVYERRPRRVV